MANKLHELLAVEQDRKHKANQAVGEAIKVFTKQDVFFDGMSKHYVSLEEDSEQIPDEIKEMVSTVKEKMSITQEAVIAGIDAHISKEETNAAGVAKSELMVDGKNLGTFSATSLLALEGQLAKIKELYQAIPTLDSTKKWLFDSQKGFYKTEEEVKFRSVKRPKVIVKYEATKEHPAQTELLYLDFQVGKYETVYTSGKITPAQKATMLKRIDDLLEAVKVARSKANNVDVNNIKIGQKVFDFINEGIF
jgi:oligoribonuclease NrnB/cAMP/cGMP phosphodiesterase (DHH superfamily)